VSPRAWPDRVRDILTAIQEIETFIGGMAFDDFRDDAKTLKAVLANFAIIGEAARHVPDDVCAVHADIPWKSMRAMRNFVVHVYFGVEPAIVWKTVHDDLPKLRRQLEQIIPA